MRRRTVFVAAILLAAVLGSSQIVIPYRESVNRFSTLPPAAQSYYIEGFEEGMYATGLALQEWMRANERSLSKAQYQQLAILSTIGTYAFNRLEQDDMRYLIEYSDEEFWELDVVHTLIEEVKRYTKEHPDGK